MRGYSEQFFSYSFKAFMEFEARGISFIEKINENYYLWLAGITILFN